MRNSKFQLPFLSIIALDAYVLIQVYEVLVRLAKEQSSDIDLEPPISMKWLKASKNEKRRARQRGDNKQKQQLLQVGTCFIETWWLCTSVSLGHHHCFV